MLVRGWQFAGTGTVYSGSHTPQLSARPTIWLRPHALIVSPTARSLTPPPTSGSIRRLRHRARQRFHMETGRTSDGPNAATSTWRFQNVPTRRARQGPVPRETFNTTNHTNLNPPNVTSMGPTGTITKAKAARHELGLRVEF
jgi:hypothetical protein